MNVCKSTIEEYFSSGKTASLDVSKINLFAVDSIALFVVVFVVVTFIARALVADGQEIEVVVVRLVVKKWFRTTALYHLVVNRWP